MKYATPNNVQVVKCGETGVLIRSLSGGRWIDRYWQPKARASWIDCTDRHHIGQRSLSFMKKLAASSESGIQRSNNLIAGAIDALRSSERGTIVLAAFKLMASDARYLDSLGFRALIILTTELASGRREFLETLSLLSVPSNPVSAAQTKQSEYIAALQDVWVVICEENGKYYDVCGPYCETVAEEVADYLAGKDTDEGAPKTFLVAPLNRLMPSQTPKLPHLDKALERDIFPGDTAEWNQGYKAEKAGKLFTSNPHENASIESYRWGMGWEAARRDSNAERRNKP